MTKQKLSQLYFLNREIEELQRRIAELECLSTSCTAQITGMPKASGISDKVAKYAVEIADLKDILDLNYKKCFLELKGLNRYIESIENSEIRQIISLRYINGLSWNQVAASICFAATEDSVRKKHDRFLRENADK